MTQADRTSASTGASSPTQTSARILFREGLRGINSIRRLGAGERSHYTIGELAERFGVTPRALRFYEEKGMLQPTRHRAWRLYSDYDVERFKLILMGKRVGLILSEIREILALQDGGASEAELLRFTLAKLQEQADFLKLQQREVAQALAELEDTRQMLHHLMRPHRDQRRRKPRLAEERAATWKRRVHLESQRA